MWCDCAYSWLILTSCTLSQGQGQWRAQATEQDGAAGWSDLPCDAFSAVHFVTLIIEESDGVAIFAADRFVLRWAVRRC